MDWPAAIARNRDALMRIVVTLFAMLGISETATIERIPRALHSAVLRILRPAEAAVRRLIFVAAKDVVLKPRKERSKPMGKIERTGKGEGRTKRPLFKLEDLRPPMVPGPPRRRYAKNGPRVSVLWSGEQDVTGPTIAHIMAQHRARYLASQPVPQPSP
ncbi:MAG: hypothetical protein HC855_12025, partial [Rhizobiales bacterium]|nr:hypothetical protein [Hyphomicrobiales bacterium]